MKAKTGVFLRQAAVLAAVSRALADEMTRRRVHSGGFGTAESRPRFSLEQPKERIRADHAFKLLQLRGGQETLSMFLGELVVASLSLVVGYQSDESSRELDGHALRQRAKQLLESGRVATGLHNRHDIIPRPRFPPPWPVPVAERSMGQIDGPVGLRARVVGAGSNSLSLLPAHAPVEVLGPIPWRSSSSWSRVARRRPCPSAPAVRIRRRTGSRAARGTARAAAADRGG